MSKSLHRSLNPKDVVDGFFHRRPNRVFTAGKCAARKLELDKKALGKLAGNKQWEPMLEKLEATITLDLVEEATNQQSIGPEVIEIPDDV